MPFFVVHHTMTEMKPEIRNIVFDMGKVIIQFDPDRFLDRAGVFDHADRMLLKKEIYESPLWIEMDRGVLTEEGMIRIVKPVLPKHLQQYTEELIAGWCDPIEPVPGMEELVHELKEKGYGIYLLSNASVMQKMYWKQVGCSPCFDGTVVSAFEGVMKPDRRIYEILLERYGLAAEECLFIDDRKGNLRTAEEMGIAVYLFDGDAGKLRTFMKEMKIL